MRSTGDITWDKAVMSRHGSLFYSKWWCDEKSEEMPIKINSLPRNLTFNDNYTLTYVQIEDPDTEPLREQFLKNIEGQVYVKY